MDTKRQVRVVKATRRMRTLTEKRAIVEETLAPGASVAAVARRHGANANLVFNWRRLYQQGLLEPDARVDAPRLLPVQVVPPAASVDRALPVSGAITITLACGHRIELHAPFDVRALAPVLDLLLPRC